MSSTRFPQAVALSLLAADCMAGGTAAPYAGNAVQVDMDVSRNGGPERTRIALRLGDSPRLVQLGKDDDLCVQAFSPEDGGIAIRVRALRPSQTAVEVITIGGNNIVPETFRTTTWGLLLRLVSPDTAFNSQARKPGPSPDLAACEL